MKNYNFFAVRENRMITLHIIMNFSAINDSIRKKDGFLKLFFS